MIQSIIALRGLGFAIASLASGSQGALPSRIDEITIIDAIAAEDDTMVTTFIVEDESWNIDADGADLLRAQRCEVPVFRSLLEAGATLIDVYNSKLGLPLARVITRADDCL